MLLKRLMAATAMAVVVVIAASASSLKVSFDKPTSDASFSLSESTILIDKSDNHLTATVADMLSGDIEAVTGHRPAVVTKATKGRPAVIIATAGSQLVRRLEASGVISTQPISTGYERYAIKLVDNPLKGCPRALIIIGNDPRGAAYGALSVSEAIGVSPWYWWADVPVNHHASAYVGTDGYVSASPSVRYRGIFINDEDWGLTPWASSTFEPEEGNVGPRTYEKVCELLLRLKANMLAPAMHTCTTAFYVNPANKIAADKYGIMITTSHCEPLLFNNASRDEWDSKRDGEWNYKTNRATIYNKLDRRVAEAAPYENIYTMAMRGLHDEGMRGDMSVDEKVKVLHQAIMDQREILSRYLPRPVDSIPQIFVPYKEAQELYESGLEVPEDITLVWPDDNYGYMKMLSNPRDRRRSGRAGVYYHVSYLGVPHDYLWISTTAPMLIYEEMKKAYDTGADRYWLLNVGDIKPMELSMQLFFAMAWDFDRFSYSNVNDYQTDFLCSIFGDDHRTDIHRLLDEYYRLAWSRKPEAMGWEREWDAPEFTGLRDTEFSFDNYNDAQNRLADYDALASLAEKVMTALPEALQPSFFEMIGYQALGSNQMNRKFLLAQLNHEQAAARHHGEANWAAARCRAAIDSLQVLTDRYNTQLGGKWNRMMTIPQGICALYQNTPSLTTYDDVADRPVNLAPVGEKSKLERCGYVDVTSFSKIIADPSHDIRILNGIGYDWRSLQLGEALQPTVDASDPDCPLRVEYTLPPVDSDSLTVILYTVPRFPLYKGANARFAIAVDDAAPVVTNLIPKEQSKPWKDDVIRNATVTRATFPISRSATSHRLAINCGDPGLIVERILLDWGGLKPTYVGPSNPQQFQ